LLYFKRNKCANTKKFDVGNLLIRFCAICGDNDLDCFSVELDTISRIREFGGTFTVEKRIILLSF
jgi:hypothetical protein